MLHGLTHIWDLKKLISQKLRVKWWLPEAEDNICTQQRKLNKVAVFMQWNTT